MDLELEKKKIEKTIQLFFDGFDNLDAELIIKAFYSTKAEMFSIKNSGKVQKTPVNNWRIMCEITIKQSDATIEKSKKNIVYIDVAGCAAQAKVEYIFSTYKYTDYYNLLKIENRWYIMNKTFDTKFFN